MKLFAAIILIAATSAHAGIIRQDVRHFSKAGSTGLIGDVTISEGSNIVLTQIGQNITITATSSGGSTEAWTTVNSDYTVTTADLNILADATNNAISLTAFTVSGNTGRKVCVEVQGNHAVTVASPDRINRSGTYIMTLDQESACFKTNGSTFYVF